jgi:hypothetical protein
VSPAAQLAANLAALPARAFAAHPLDPCNVIELFRGEPGYLDTLTCETAERAAEYVALLNEGIVPVPDGPVREAMIFGSMFGWDKRPAHPDAWRNGAPDAMPYTVRFLLDGSAAWRSWVEPYATLERARRAIACWDDKPDFCSAELWHAGQRIYATGRST